MVDAQLFAAQFESKESLGLAAKPQFALAHDPLATARFAAGVARPLAAVEIDCVDDELVAKALNRLELRR